MAERDGTIIEFPRGRHIGPRVCDVAKEEHFYKCPACGGWVDCRELGQVFDHEGPITASGRRLAPTRFSRALTSLRDSEAPRPAVEATGRGLSPARSVSGSAPVTDCPTQEL
jgi:hypothetical protein